MHYSGEFKKRFSNTSNIVAKKFLFKYGYSCSSFTMPDYYEITGFDKMKLKEIDWKKVPITKTVDIFTPKGNLSWRRFSFFHPFMYWHIVNLITEKENWDYIKKHLCQSTKVACYSFPDFKLKHDQTVQGQSIEGWLQMAERDLIKNCANYNFLTVTDIQNFYSSIYTHSIGWALHSKEKARSDRYKYKLIGTKLDRLFQNSRETQTNGIPIGSLASDIIAEIVLVKVDYLLSEWLVKEKLDSKIFISRFRDDYRILSKNISDAKKTLKGLNRILCDNFDLTLNANKTFTYEDVIENAFRPWNVAIRQSFLLRGVVCEDLPKKISSSYLKDVFLETYQIQKKYLQGRVANSVLSKLSKKMDKKDLEIKINESNIAELISFLRKIILIREETTPHSISLIGFLLNNSRPVIKRQFIEEMINILD